HERVQEQDRHHRERQHAAGVDRPGLLTVGVDPDRAVDDPFGPGVVAALDHAVHVVAQRSIGHGQGGYQDDDEDDARRRVAHQNFSGFNRATTRNTVSAAARTRPATFAALTASPPPSP